MYACAYRNLCSLQSLEIVTLFIVTSDLRRFPTVVSALYIYINSLHNVEMQPSTNAQHVFRSRSVYIPYIYINRPGPKHVLCIGRGLHFNVVAVS